MKGIKTRCSEKNGLRYGGRGGRPELELDLGFITSLTRAGLGCRAIAARYYEEFSVVASPATIARRLKGLEL